MGLSSLRISASYPYVMMRDFGTSSGSDHGATKLDVSTASSTLVDGGIV